MDARDVEKREGRNKITIGAHGPGGENVARRRFQEIIQRQSGPARRGDAADRLWVPIMLTGDFSRKKDIGVAIQKRAPRTGEFRVPMIPLSITKTKQSRPLPEL